FCRRNFSATVIRMLEASYSFLKQLLETPSPSGFEIRGQRVWADYAGEFADTVESDSYGNVYATLNKEGSPKIALAGHSDELGLMVSYISEEGFLYFKGIGGVDRAMLRGRRVIVHGPAGPVPGVTGHLAIHMQEQDDRKKVPEFHEVFIDIGVRSRSEAEKLVRIGDAVTNDANVFELTEGRIAARACDNRIGTWAAAEALRYLAAKRTQLNASVVAVSTIQEENGLYGAMMAAYRVRPEAALVVDVAHATDIPICSKTKHGDIKLGGGPVIGLGSANHPVLIERLRAIASMKGIPLQYEANPRFSGTDADAIFVQRGGIPTVSIGLPDRYMHSPVEVIDLADLEAIASLIAEFCLDLKRDEVFAVRIQEGLHRS
ncbi:MAG TPA: M42 family metallopeptidase, partial [Terrimicrobiaceae bacterium]